MSFKNEIGKQVLILDGAMGTMIQDLELDDAAFGGTEFKMLSDLLVFSRPDELGFIHLKYLQAGANLIETNTFGASPLRLKEFDFTKLDPADLRAIPENLDLRNCAVEDLTRHLNIEGCRIACRAIEKYKTDPDYDGRPLFVAGSIGPSNYVVSSTQADLNQATFGQIVDNFYHQVCGLIAGGADVLLVETQQDILETKAIIVGARKAFAEK
ncbi:MAG: homocysteine S-methyltransferase family protein, partial [Nitrospinaceae bacterium]|nr:homocysteine S-methyltransferase family protein [Nitrospinaceae bacterium]